MLDHLGLIRLAVQVSAGRLFQLFHQRRAAARRCLIGGDDQAPDGISLVHRPERHQRGDGGAVGIGDDTFMILQAMGVDFRHYQRNGRIGAEGRGIVDHHRTGFHRDGRILPGDAAAGGEQRDIDTVEGILLQFFNCQLLATEGLLLTGRTRRGQQLQRRQRYAPAFQAADKFTAHCAGGADNRDILVLHLIIPFRQQKSPVQSGAGLGFFACSVRLSARDPSPIGLGGRLGALGGRAHGGETYGAIRASSTALSG